MNDRSLDTATRTTAPTGVSLPAFALHLVASIAFGAAFVLPFVSSDFNVTLSPGVQSASDAAFDPCGKLESSVGIPLPDGLCAPLRRLTTRAAGASLDATLGPVDEQVGFGWTDCVRRGGTRPPTPDAPPEPEATRLPEDDKPPGPGVVSACAKQWITTTAGIPVGERYLHSVLTELWSAQEQALFALVLLFSVLFPLTKVGLGLMLSIRPARGGLGRALLAALRLTSRFSMTDVFVVALLVVLFKAEAWNFHFRAEPGVWAFAVGAICSSVGVWWLERQGANPARKG